MAKSIVDQSSQEVLSRLDEQLKECTPLEAGEKGYGLDYAVRLEEIRKVSPVNYWVKIIIIIEIIRDLDNSSQFPFGRKLSS
jgi:hypothetical protein